MCAHALVLPLCCVREARHGRVAVVSARVRAWRGPLHTSRMLGRPDAAGRLAITAPPLTFAMWELKAV